MAFLFPFFMHIPAVQLLCLEQEGRSLENHMMEFLDLAYVMSDYVTYYVGLNNSTKAKLSRDASSREFYGVGAGEQWSAALKSTSPAPTPDPEPSYPSAPCTERLPEPTAEGEPEPASINEPALKEATDSLSSPQNRARFKF